MSAHDSDVVLLVSGKHRALISGLAAQKRLTDGLGTFKGNTKIHRIKFQKSEPRPGDVLVDYGILDENGKCRNCETGKCRPVRVSVMCLSFVSHGAAEPWTRMRVRGDRRRKNNSEAPLLREFDPRHIAWEAREIQTGPKLGTPFLKEMNQVDELIRQLELEGNQAFIDGGNDALIKLQSLRKQLFIEMLEKLEQNQGWARHIAEYVVKLNRIVFPKRADVPKKWRSLLDELEDIVAERRASLEDLRELSRLGKNSPEA